MKLALSTHAQDNVRNTHHAQVWFFVCQSRRADAPVLSAHICKATADRQAKAWSCPNTRAVVRVGHVEGEQAVTL